MATMKSFGFTALVFFCVCVTLFHFKKFIKQKMNGLNRYIDETENFQLEDRNVMIHL